MDPGKTPGQTGLPRPSTPTVPSLETVVRSHSTQLTKLNADLTTAFSQMTTEVGQLRASSSSTADTLAALTAQVAALTQALPQALQPAPSATPPLVASSTAAPSPASAASASPPAPPDPRFEPNLPCPRPYGGEFDLCRGFLGQCELLFKHQPSRYGAGEARIALVMSLLTGRALNWAIAAAGPSSSLSTDYTAFLEEFRLVFDHPPDGPDGASRLHTLSQGARSVADFTLEFRVLAAESSWDDAALRSAYRRGLGDAIKDLIIRDQPRTLAELIALALQVDERLRERRAERAQRAGPARPSTARSPVAPSALFIREPTPPTMSATTRSEEEPMQLGRSRLTPEEREQRMRDRLCLYCGKPGHHIRACPTRPKDVAH